WAADRNVQPGRTGGRLDPDVLFIEMEQAEKIDEIRLHEAQATQIGEFLVAEAHLAQVGDARANFVGVGRKIDALGAALEDVLDLRARKMVQHDLHHRELVQVGVEQRLDDHPGRIVTFARCAAVTRSMPTRRWSLCSSDSMRSPSSRRATTSARAAMSSLSAA